MRCEIMHNARLQRASNLDQFLERDHDDVGILRHRNLAVSSDYNNANAWCLRYALLHACLRPDWLPKPSQARCTKRACSLSDEQTMADSSACPAMYLTTSGPKVSYMGTVTMLYELQACVLISSRAPGDADSAVTKPAL